MKKKKILGLALLAIMLAMPMYVVYIRPVSAAEDSWVWVGNTVTGAWGEAVVGTGDAIYVARKMSFYSYNPIGGWTTLANPPNPDSGDTFKTGTALAWDFGDYIYALCGAATSDSRKWFYRYSISEDSWEVLANTTVDQGEGDSLACVGNSIYATIGGEQRPTYFMRYDVSTDSWSDTPANPPAGMGDGASLVWTGGDFLYALRGEFDETLPLCDFWRYSLLDDIWTAIADIPAGDGGEGGVGDGGSLIYVGSWLTNQTDYIYALSGNQVLESPDNRTYRYTISLGSWERLADLPFKVGYYVGCRLGYADGYIYAWQGTPSTWTGGGDDLAKYEFPPASANPVGGILWENTTWTLENSPYIITSPVLVNSSVTLTIESGVTVYLNDTYIRVDGTLNARGTSENPISLICNGTGLGALLSTGTPAIQFSSESISWDEQTGLGSIIENAVVSSTHNSHTIYVDNVSPKINNCTVINSANARAIYLESGAAIISNCSITAGDSMPGISCGSASLSGNDAQILDNIITDCGAGIAVYAGSPVVEGNLIANNIGSKSAGLGGIRIDGASTSPTIRNNTIVGNSVGFNIQRSSSPTIVFNNILSNLEYNVYLHESGSDINATHNWWGTTDPVTINQTIHDFKNDFNLGTVNFVPFLTEPHPDNPTLPLTVNFTYSPAALYAHGTVTFNATASSGPYSSIANYTWNFGDGNITTTSFPIVKHAYVTSDSYGVTLTVTDEFGFQNSTATSLTVLQDDAPPTTVDDYDGGWRNADFTITLTATDHKSGVTETYYRINQGEVKAVSTDGQPRITVEGANNTLEYWSVDNAGNEELPHKILTGINLDKTTIIFDAGIWEGTQYNVYVISNSTVSDFSFNPDEGALLRFNVTGETGTTGFCNVTIPKDLLDSENSWIVLVDGHSVTPTVNEDTSDSYIYFTYPHSTKTVEMIGTTAIPEFSSWFILPLIMIVALAVIVLKKIMLRGLNKK